MDSTSLGIKQIQTAKRSPWQDSYVERVIGSIRWVCLDHVIIFDERHLMRVLREYVDYYHRSRTHLGLEKDCPVSRPVEPIESGDIHSPAHELSRHGSRSSGSTNPRRRIRRRMNIQEGQQV